MAHFPPFFAKSLSAFCPSIRTLATTIMFESPFLKKKVEFKKEDTTLRAQFLSGLKRLDGFFVDAIPSDDVKQLPTAYMYPVGVMVFIVLLGIFTGVFVPGKNF